MLDLVNLVWVDEDGSMFPVTNAFDSWGDDTDDAEEVVVIVIQTPDDRFAVIDLREFIPFTLH